MSDLQMFGSHKISQTYPLLLLPFSLPLSSSFCFQPTLLFLLCILGFLPLSLLAGLLSRFRPPGFLFGFFLVLKLPATLRLRSCLGTPSVFFGILTLLLAPCSLSSLTPQPCFLFRLSLLFLELLDPSFSGLLESPRLFGLLLCCLLGFALLSTRFALESFGFRLLARDRRLPFALLGSRLL